jgi:hypothetical protein
MSVKLKWQTTAHNENCENVTADTRGQLMWRDQKNVTTPPAAEGTHRQRQVARRALSTGPAWARGVFAFLDMGTGKRGS